MAISMEAASKRASELHTSTRMNANPGASSHDDATAGAAQYVGRKPRRNLSRNRSNSSCYRCGKTNHAPDQCFYKNKKCRKCSRQGHIAKMCQSKDAGKRVDLVEDGAQAHSSSSDPEVDDCSLLLSNIKVVNSKPRSFRKGILVKVLVGNIPLEMELDTGASVSLISEGTWKRVLKAPPLSQSDVRLKTYTGESLEVLGQLSVGVKYGEQFGQMPLIVVKGSGPPLFGRDWLEKFRLDWGAIQKIDTPVEHLLREYAEVFRKELGTMQGVQARLEVKEGAVPRFHKPRSVPYAIRGAIEQDLERLERTGVIEKVRYSDWAAPVVPVPKGDGGIRLCGDYKVTVNPVLKVDQYPVPTPEDLFATLAGGESFTKLDLTQAYQQVPLEPESRKYVTVNTHKGLYQYTRLPFGVASAPAVFQQIIEKVLQGIPHVVAYLDDVLITGRNESEHLSTLRQVLERFKLFGIRLKQAKCEIMKPHVQYLGYLIDKNGLHTMPDKIAAIQDAPRPKNVRELRSFLGLVNYYGRFIQNSSTVTYPLNQLLCDGTPWVWDKGCEQAFMKLKQVLASSEVLAHYNQELPVKLDCDASAYGVGAVLSHTYPDGTERPIAYASRTLTCSEKNYAQIEKEGLAIIFGVKRFHKYLYGRHFTLVTDHKPLVTIFGSHEKLPTLAAARLQRWAVFLLGYQYTLEFRSTEKHDNADCFSRLPRDTTVSAEAGLDRGTVTFNLHQIKKTPVSAKQLALATSADPVLSKVMRYCRDGWPTEVPVELQSYFRKKEEISMESNCLFRGTRVIIPASLQSQILSELHEGHQGIVKMKGLARSRIWWPRLDNDIEQEVRSCTPCQEHRNQPAPVPLHPWPWAKNPWDRIHLDFAGPVDGTMYLVLVDSHSKWLEVVPMSSTTTEKTVGVLRTLFARYGLPKELVTDNGPQFTAMEFSEFIRNNGIRHCRSAPYHPATNGAAERCVQTLKNALRAKKGDQGSLSLKLAQFLMAYRNTPHSTTGLSPAELFLKRPLRTRLDVMRPTVEDRVISKQEEQRKCHDKHARGRNLEEGEAVLVRQFRNGPKWIRGTVQKKRGPVSYEVKVGNQVWHRHANQLLRDRGAAGAETGLEEELPDLAVPDLPGLTTDAQQSATSTEATICRDFSPNLETTEHNNPETCINTEEHPRYPQRMRHAPGRWDPSFQ